MCLYFCLSMMFWHSISNDYNVIYLLQDFNIISLFLSPHLLLSLFSLACILQLGLLIRHFSVVCRNLQGEAGLYSFNIVCIHLVMCIIFGLMVTGLGQVQLKMGDLRSALSNFEKVLEVYPDNCDALKVS